MKLGILSDTHDRFSIALKAVRRLQGESVEFLVHCGDVGDSRMLDVLAGTPSAFVFGNNDYDRAGLRNYAQLIGIQCLGAYGVLELAGKRIAVTHGDDGPLLARLRRPGQPFDYLLTGHTHLPHDRRFDSLRWINPGALHRAPAKSVAVLDLENDDLQFIPIEE